ncbi:TPA: hypothetical protein ACXE0P_005549, partial [Klebsiella pneumoniae]
GIQTAPWLGPCPAALRLRGLRIQFNGGLQCRLYAGYGVAAIRQTGGSLAVAMPGGATLARAYGSSSMVGSSAVCRPGKP